jgi:hypothetical protein
MVRSRTARSDPRVVVADMPIASDASIKPRGGGLNSSRARSRMRLTGLLAMITFLMPQVATAQFVRHNSIPQAYWGTWAPVDSTCEDADNASVALSEHAYWSPTTSCIVEYARRTPGPKGPTCSARMQCSERAQAVSETIANLIIRPSDNDHVFMGSEFANLKPYHRCSTAGPYTARRHDARS